MLALPRSGLAFPGAIDPGIDPSHIAFKDRALCRFSAVARGGGFIDLTTGMGGVNANAPTRTIDGQIGDSVRYASTAITTFAGRPTAVDPNLTFAAIVKWTNIAGTAFSFIFANSTGSTYNAFFANSAGNLGVRISGGNVLTATVMQNNVPYFVAMSSGVNVVNAVIARLDIGQVYASHPSAAAANNSAPNGTYEIGNGPQAGTLPLNGIVAAVAHLNGCLSLPQLVQWASAPWDFWYPPLRRRTIFQSLSRPVVPASTQTRAMIMA